MSKSKVKIKAPDITGLVAQIHADPIKAFIVVTGGGSESLGWLLREGGGSATLLEFVAPYSQHCMTAFLGQSPTQYCSGEASVMMAERAFYKGAIEIRRDTPGPVVGIGLTCSLAKNGNERPGRVHHMYGAARTLKERIEVSVTLLQGKTRQEEEFIASYLVLHLLAMSAEISSDWPAHWPQLSLNKVDLPNPHGGE